MTAALPHDLRKVVMSVNIRPAEPGDAVAVVAMAAELNAHERRPARRFSEADFRRDGFGPRAAFSCLIAEAEGLAVGYALYHPSYDAEAGHRGAFIHDLYLRPAHRRRGIGSALLAAVGRSVEQAGGSFVWWCMIDGNKAAESFYGHYARPLGDLRIWIAQDQDFLRLAVKGAEHDPNDRT